ncbi:MAG TPA: glycosyltransferase family 2 protein [Levilinea sp.]|nr:glycosyltransferase family 2 protein [Levilinea sp.]
MTSTDARPLLTVVVPAYNEAGALPDVAPGLLEYCRARGWQVVFVNDGSKDSTREILEGYTAPDVLVVHHKVNRGYGGALKTGIRRVNTPYLVTIDADGQHCLEDIDRLLQFALENDADMVVGKRDQKSGGDPYRTIGKWIIRRYTRILLQMPVTDLNSGFKLYRAGLAQRYITVCPDSMAFSDVITLVFINERNLVLEHPIHISPRRSGQSTITAFTAFETVMEILNITLMFHPMRVFLPISALCMLAGFGWGLPIIILGRGVSVGAMLAIVTGLLFFVIGLLASQLSAMRMERLRDNPNSH